MYYLARVVVVDIVDVLIGNDNHNAGCARSWSPLVGPSAQEAEAVAPDVAPLAQADRLGPSLPRRYRLRRLRLLPPPRCLRRAVTQEAQPPEQEIYLFFYGFPNKLTEVNHRDASASNTAF